MATPLAELEVLPTLRSERTTIRPLTAADAAALFEVYSDPEAMRYWSTPPHADESRTRKLIADIHRGFEERTVLQWGVERTADRRLLGTITLMTEEEQPRAELGFILGSEHWHQGYGGETQRVVVDFAFETLSLHRLEAEADQRNTASLRSLERLGFRHEGLLRERWCVDGEISDSVVLGLLAREWADRDD